MARSFKSLVVATALGVSQIFNANAAIEKNASATNVDRQFSDNVTKICTLNGVPAEVLSALNEKEGIRVQKMCTGYYWGLWNCAPYQQVYQGMVNSYTGLKPSELDPKYKSLPDNSFVDDVKAHTKAFNAKNYGISDINDRMNSWNDAVKVLFTKSFNANQVVTIDMITNLTRQPEFKKYCP